MLPVPVAFPLGHPREILGWTPSGSLILDSLASSLSQFHFSSLLLNLSYKTEDPPSILCTPTYCSSLAVNLRLSYSGPCPIEALGSLPTGCRLSPIVSPRLLSPVSKTPHARGV